jgi:general secretion pathway protein G
MRNDRFIVPLNCDFDLYSKGKDGKSVPRLSDEVSIDDIIRANNGTYIGLACEY